MSFPRGRLTHERLAEMVACCREAVSPKFARLRHGGVLGVGWRGGVLDRPALAQAALPPFIRM